MTEQALAGKVAIVTGGAQGMGETTAKLFARAGAEVAVVDLNEEAGRRVVAEIEEAGGRATFLSCDISRAEQVEAMVAATVATYGRLDCAVNNAAVANDNEPVAEFDEATYDRIMAVDLKGTFHCNKYQIKQLLAQGGGGSIVNVASIVGFRPNRNSPVYNAAKAGVWSLTQSAALDYGKYGIRVNCVAPGAIDTPMLQEGLRARRRDVDAYRRIMSNLHRIGEPDEVANAHLWLCSDASSYITGSVLHLDGGYVQTPPYEFPLLDD
ncbi:SDR family oxidoreductase [Streptomyces chlorus]|uniref:SDR family NAD(P)-dependent oxidoreductase n=1 Tax=Streptomyces chlorus TaxID=887452 RepID=A0ABW1DZT5_9ACTN